MPRLATAWATASSLLLENRPEHLLHKLAMNALGICCVPLNADHRPREMAYVLHHAKVDLVVVADELQRAAAGRAGRLTHRPARGAAGLTGARWPRAAVPAAVDHAFAGHAGQRALHLGHHRPTKGCVLSHRYELEAGRW